MGMRDTMNTQTVFAQEVLLQHDSGVLLDDAYRGVFVDCTVRFVDCATAEESRDLQARCISWRLAWSTGQAVGRNQMTGLLSSLDKIDFKAICLAWLEALSAKRDAADAERLANFRAWDAQSEGVACTS